jgi:hypothetical protein
MAVEFDSATHVIQIGASRVIILHKFGLNPSLLAKPLLVKTLIKKALIVFKHLWLEN